MYAGGPFRVTVQDKSDLSRARVDPHFAQWVETGIRSIDIDVRNSFCAISRVGCTLCCVSRRYVKALRTSSTVCIRSWYTLVVVIACHGTPVGLLGATFLTTSAMLWILCSCKSQTRQPAVCSSGKCELAVWADDGRVLLVVRVDRVAEAFGADDPNAIAVPSSPVWSVGTDTKQEVGTTTSSSSTFGTQCGDDEEDVVLVERRESTPTLADSEFWQDCAMPEALIISNAVISDEREGADGTPDTTSSEAKDDVRDVVARVIGVGLMGAPMEVATGGEDFDGVMVECDTISEFCEVGSEDCHTDGDSDCESWVAL